MKEFTVTLNSDKVEFEFPSPCGVLGMKVELDGAEIAAAACVCFRPLAGF